MKKNNVIHFNNFMDGSFKNEPTNAQKVVLHFKKNKHVYIRVGLMATSLCLSVFHPALAATPTALDVAQNVANGNWDIDKQGYEIYRQLLGIGKWVIVVKGGWDVVRSTLSNDYDKAKKGFISYVLAYIFLLILPELMNRADGIVHHLSARG